MEPTAAIHGERKQPHEHRASPLRPSTCMLVESPGTSTSCMTMRCQLECRVASVSSVCCVRVVGSSWCSQAIRPVVVRSCQPRHSSPARRSPSTRATPPRTRGCALSAHRQPRPFAGLHASTARAGRQAAGADSSLEGRPLGSARSQQACTSALHSTPLHAPLQAQRAPSRSASREQARASL